MHCDIKLQKEVKLIFKDYEYKDIHLELSVRELYDIAHIIIPVLIDHGLDVDKIIQNCHTVNEDK